MLNFRCHADVGRQLPLFVAVSASNYLIFVLGLTDLLSAVGVYYELARVIAACCEAVYLYCMLRWVVFRDTAAPSRRRYASAGQAARHQRRTASAGAAQRWHRRARRRRSRRARVARTAVTASAPSLAPRDEATLAAAAAAGGCPGGSLAVVQVRAARARATSSIVSIPYCSHRSCRLSSVSTAIR